MDELWTRQPCDTEESWPVFQDYRDQAPPRRLRPGRAGTEQVRKWYVEHAWRERVVAYDKWVDEVRLEEREAFLRQDSRSVSAEIRSIAKDMRVIAQAEIEKLLLLATTSENPITHRIGDIVKLAEAAQKMGRLEHGEATENINVGPDLSKLPPEDLVKMRELLAKSVKKP